MFDPSPNGTLEATKSNVLIPFRNLLYAFAFGVKTLVATLATVGVYGDVDIVDNPPDAIVAPVRIVLPINALLVRSATT